MQRPGIASQCLSLACLSIGFLQLGRAEKPLRVSIDSSWTGLGPSRKASSSFTCKSETRPQSDTRCDTALYLLDLLEKPGQEYSLEALQIDQAWLNLNSETAIVQDLKHLSKDSSDEQIELFRRSFRDEALVLRAFKSDLDSAHLDDYPFFRLVIRNGSGAVTSIESANQLPLMTPWSVSNHGRTWQTFDARISRAVFSLLPSKFPNRGRIGGLGLRQYFSDDVMREIEPAWGILESKRLVGPQFEAVQKKYNIQSSRIAIVSSTDVGGPEDGISSCWHATLEASGLLHNVKIGFSLPYEQGRLLGFDAFLEKIEAIKDVFRSVEWLNSYLEGHPDTNVVLRFVKNRSFGLRAEKSLQADLLSHGHANVLDQIQPFFDHAAFVFVHEPGDQWSSWLIIPDRRMLLWQFKGQTALGFQTAGIPSWDRDGQRSTATFVSSAGVLSAAP